MTHTIAHECRICGTMFDGPFGSLFHLLGITRSPRNPNICNRCDGHMQEGHIRELTVLFADLTGFTEMTNRLGAERSYEVVDAFFKMANEVLIAHDAFIDKYIGDAVMAIFNAPITDVQHARKAIQAGLGIQAGLASVAQAVGLPLQTRVGIASGYARIGRLGSADRKDYTVIGDVVNLASRLESLAQPGEIVVEGSAFAQVRQDFATVLPEVVTVRGFANPVEIYRIGQSAQEAHMLTQQPEPMAVRQSISVGTLLFTLLSTPCAAMASLSPLAILLGIGASLSTLAPLMQRLDIALIRIPLHIFAVLGALVNLYVIWRNMQMAQGHASARLTLQEKHKTQLVALLSALTFLAVGYEIYMHTVVEGMSYLSPLI